MLRKSRVLIVLGTVICVSVGLFQLLTWANAYYSERAQDAGRTTLLLVAETVDQAVGRFMPTPILIAGEPALGRMLTEQSPEGVAPFVNERLRQIAISINAAEVYMMDKTGRTVAASNYRDDDSFVGINFEFRPYFSQSIKGKAAVFHALGTTSGERGFFFSAPILDGINVIGVLAVKMTVEALEQDWLGIDDIVLIADENGVVFLTSRDEYRFRALAPLSEAVQEQILATKQFPLDSVVPLDMSVGVIDHGTVQVEIGSGASKEQFIASSTPLELPGWHAIVFTPLDPVKNQVFRTMAIGAITVTALLLAILLVVQRRANVLQRIRIEQEQRAMLEERVRERTADLDEANASLRNEVSERRQAEERLRKSQKELVQAGKLAALGKMSAAISHEINQPLAAIKSYAVNASEYLSRTRIEDAQSNIQSISVMSDRMTKISQHLRNFARQPGDTLKPINVTEVINETLGLVGPQIRAQGAEIIFVPSDHDVWALGGKLRLQQVLVNIVSNALEAMSEQKHPRIEFDVQCSKKDIKIIVRDYGPGVPIEDLDQVFDAFYTTKTAGAGMGLGMSISHNIISDFGGALSADNHPDGGAIFTVSLQRQDASQIGGAGS